MNHRKLIVISALAFVLFALQAIADEPAPQLIGSWQVLSVVDGTTDEVPSLFTYSPGGVFVASGPTVSNSASHGAWERSGPRTYTSTEISFLYGASGEIVATLHADATLEVAIGGQTYDAVFEGEVRVSGGPVIPFSGTATGSRISVE